MGASLFPCDIESSGDFAGVATIRLTQPGRPVVVLDHELISSLEATLQALPSGLRGLVVASASERVFVAGADLKSISEWDDDRLLRYLQFGSRVFGLLASFPFPTVAAINGAALGGGLELAMHCDGVVAAPPPARDGQPGKPYPVGLPEAGLAICPGWGGTNLLPARMDPAKAIAATVAGKTMMIDEAISAGMFDAVAPDASSLLTTAKQWVCAQRGGMHRRDGAPRRWIGRLDRVADVLHAADSVKNELAAAGTLSEPALAVLSAVNAGLSQGWSEALAVEQRELVRLRHRPDAKAALEAFFAKSAGTAKKG